MPVVISTISSLQQFAIWLLDHATPNIFKSVTMETSDTMIATDYNDNVVLRVNTVYLRAYRAYGNYLEYSSGGYSLFSDTWPAPIIGCDNGFMLTTRHKVGGSSRVTILVSLTNNGEPGIMFNSYGSSTDTRLYTSDVKHVAFGDHPTLSTTLTFTPESAGQTVLAPFATDPEVGSISYTPYAFYMPVSQSYGIGFGKFRLGSDTYITNGYWCIKT